MSEPTTSVADQRAAADAAVEADQAAGLYSLFVIIGMIADEEQFRRGSPERKGLGDRIEEAARAGQFPVYDRSQGRLLDSNPAHIGFQHIAYRHEVRAWFDRTCGRPMAEPVFMSPLSNGVWLIADAAAALANQQQLSVDGRRSLAKQMGDCAKLPADAVLHLRTRHLETSLPLPATEVTCLAAGVFPSDVNDWLAACNAGYSWNVAPSNEDGQAASVCGGSHEPKLHTAAPAASLTTDEVCAAFDNVGMTSLEWRNTITKNLPNWLTACRTMVGKPGANPVQARWDPLKLAIALVTGLSRKAGVVPVAKLDAAFRQTLLQKFKPSWEALRADNPAWGD